MRKLIIIITCVLCTGTVKAQSVYSYSINTIEGNTKALNTYQGKKILVITLPTTQNSSNDSLLHSLDSLSTVYASSLVIIAAPSYEDGYSPAIKNDLNTWYRSILGNEIIITDGIYTRKTSGGQQHPLFNWLTDKEKNEHFNQDVTGPKSKFVVWTDGELIGALSAETRIGGSTINGLLQ